MSMTTHPANAPVTPTSESTDTFECCQKYLALMLGTLQVCNQYKEHPYVICNFVAGTYDSGSSHEPMVSPTVTTTLNPKSSMFNLVEALELWILAQVGFIQHLGCSITSRCRLEGIMKNIIHWFIEGQTICTLPKGAKINFSLWTERGCSSSKIQHYLRGCSTSQNKVFDIVTKSTNGEV